MTGTLRILPVIGLVVFTVGFIYWDLGAGQRDPDTINFFTMQLRPDFDDYFFDLIERFEEENPGITVNWVDYPYDGYDSRITTALLGRNPPDVINLAWDRLRAFARGGNLVHLAEQLPQAVIDGYVTQIIESGCTYDGRVYALPWYSSASITLYNRAILEEAGIGEDGIPRYFEEIPEFARRVRENTDAVPFFPILTDGGAIRSVMAEKGVEFLTEDRSRAAFNTPVAQEVLQFYKDLYDQRLIPREVITAGHRRPLELFTAGQLATYNGGAEFILRVRENAPSVYENIIIGPKISWRDHEVFFINTHILAVPERSSNPQAAAEFAAFVTNAENMLKFSKEVTIFPSVTEAFEDPWFSEPDETPEGLARYYGARQVSRGQLFQSPPESTRIYRVLDEMVEQILQGQATVEAGLANAERRVNNILAEAPRR